MKRFVLASFVLLGSLTFGQGQERVREFTFISGNHAYLGVQIRDVSSDDVTDQGLPAEAGVLIEAVEEDTPAFEADLQAGDVIVEYAGMAVFSAEQFARLVRETPPGREVAVGLIRDGQRITRNVSVRRRGMRLGGDRFAFGNLRVPEIRVLGDPEANVLFLSNRPRLGIRGEEITAQLAETLGVGQGKGVLIMEVAVDTPAERAGLRAGDVITAVDDKTVEDISDLRRALKSGTLSIQIVRDRQPRSVTAEIESPEKTKLKTRKTREL